jgi:hypothetical protein
MCKLIFVILLLKMMLVCDLILDCHLLFLFKKINKDSVLEPTRKKKHLFCFVLIFEKECQ